MPCMCWYDPPEKSKIMIKQLCHFIILELKELQKEGDPIGLKLEDVKKLLDHMWNPDACEEKKGWVYKAPLAKEWGGEARCITSDGRNVNIAEELNRIEKEKNELD